MPLAIMEHQQFAAVFHADLNPDQVFCRAEVIFSEIVFDQFAFHLCANTECISEDLQSCFSVIMQPRCRKQSFYPVILRTHHFQQIYLQILKHLQIHTAFLKNNLYSIFSTPECGLKMRAPQHSGDECQVENIFPTFGKR